ncbi:MAG TPA: TIGR03435 family protein, partial [Bryobacteraceae bacterium]
APERPLKNIDARGFPMMRGTMTTSRLASLLSTVAGRPVIDRTNLTGRYHLLLSYAPPFSQFTGIPKVSAPPDLFTAVQEQLGLKLQPNKSNLEVVVVDRIDPQPSEN